MYICNIKGVDPKKGDFLLLSDLGSEGITVVSQHKSAESAVLGMDSNYDRLAIVQIVDIQVTLP